MEDMNVTEELKQDIMSNYPMVKIEDEVQNFELEIYDPNTKDVYNKHITDFQWKWLVVMFYPADFTFVCPTELKDLNKKKAEFDALGNVELLVASTDSVFSHKSWLETESLLNWFSIPMIADRTSVLSRYFWILNDKSWNSERWTFVISPEWILKSYEVVTEPVWRSSDDLYRKLTALKFVTENPWQACPASWNNNMPTLKPSIQIAWHVWENM